MSFLQKFKRDLLVELSVKQLSVQVFGSCERVALSPYIAVEGKKKNVLAVGDNVNIYQAQILQYLIRLIINASLSVTLLAQISCCNMLSVKY